MADYNQAVKIDPKNTETYLKLGEALQMKDPKAAIAYYNQAIVLNPKNEQAYEGIATVHWTHQEYDETITAYDQLIAINPKDWSTYGFRAMAKAAKGDLDGAIRDLLFLKFTPTEKLIDLILSIVFRSETDFK